MSLDAMRQPGGKSDVARRETKVQNQRAPIGVRPKALFIGPYPPPYSGPELGMKQFLDSDLSRDFNIRFIKTNFRASNADKARIDVTAALWTAAFHLKLFWSLLLFRPSVVYYPVTFTAAGWLARDAPCLLLCRLFGVNAVIHLRAGHLRLNFQNFSRGVQRLVRRACSHVSMALVQAECLRTQFDDLVAPDRIRVLPQAVDSKEYDSGPQNLETERQVLFLGHLSFSKGYCDLLRALPIVVSAIPDVKFIFCGDIVEERATSVFFDQITGRRLKSELASAAHRRIQESRYQDHYEWRGVVQGAEKLRLLRSCSLVALPSYSEGFSRALTEAMSVGKPVVCTPVGAHREIIVDGCNGLIVEPGDVSGLANAIIALLRDQNLRERIGANNYKYVRERFDITSVAEQLGRLLLEAMNHATMPSQHRRRGIAE